MCTQYYVYLHNNKTVIQLNYYIAVKLSSEVSFFSVLCDTRVSVTYHSKGIFHCGFVSFPNPSKSIDDICTSVFCLQTNQAVL